MGDSFPGPNCKFGAEDNEKEEITKASIDELINNKEKNIIDNKNQKYADVVNNFVGLVTESINQLTKVGEEDELPIKQYKGIGSFKAYAKLDDDAFKMVLQMEKIDDLFINVIGTKIERIAPLLNEYGLSMTSELYSGDYGKFVISFKRDKKLVEEEGKAYELKHTPVNTINKEISMI